MSDLELALAHYRITFPTVASLGAAPTCPLWMEEYTRVSSSGLQATLITQVGGEAGTTSASRNFPQTVVMEALLKRRGELDSDFAETVLAPMKSPVRLGVSICFES